MTIKRASAATAVPLAVLILSGCVSQRAYNELQQQNQQLQAQVQQLQAQLAQSQAEQKFVEAGDYLFPSGGFSSALQGKQSLPTISLPSSKVSRTPRS